MSRKTTLSLAAAVGLAALAATTFAQQSGFNPQLATPSRDTARVDGPTSADLAPNPFAFTGQPRKGITNEEVSLSIEADQLARQLGQARTDDEKDTLKARIADVLNKQFDQRKRRHESEIEALEAQVKKLKELVRLRNEKRQEIVAKRLEQVVRDAEGLGW